MMTKVASRSLSNLNSRLVPRREGAGEGGDFRG